MTRRQMLVVTAAGLASPLVGAAPAPAQVLYYGDRALSLPSHAVFLAGPTVSAKAAPRTAWRLRALELLAGFSGTVIVPEFRTGGFRREPFDDGLPSTVPGMSRASERIIDWETACIDNASVLLVWMPFALGEDTSPDSLPGFSTRAEVMRAIGMRRQRLVLGMPPGAMSSGQIRYHAHKAGLRIHETLEETVRAAMAFGGGSLTP